jgi:hypothetical protein
VKDRPWIARGLFAVWFGVVSLALAHEMAPHMAPFRRTAAAGDDAAAGGWQITHVLVAGCECSRTVARALASTGPEHDALNRIVVIGNDDAIVRPLTEAGFVTSRVSADEVIRRYGIHGAPWMFVKRPDGREAYSGGYGPRRPVAVTDVHSADIVSAARAGRTMDGYPAFGCIFNNETNN